MFPLISSVLILEKEPDSLSLSVTWDGKRLTFFKIVLPVTQPASVMGLLPVLVPSRSRASVRP